MTEGQSARGRYRAFISYSHRNDDVGAWLHRKLESYRIPARLVGQKGAQGEVPARLTPIFRDLLELPVAGDLSAEVQAALTRSDHLLVLCSPAAAASPWVAREIELFRDMHPDRPILAALVDGTPETAFPPALTAGGREPIAADIRPEADNRKLGFLKIVAGLAGVGLDALVQRDAQRKLRRVMVVTVAAVAAMLALGASTWFALAARADAERQRAEAEGLVEFMLTDLRDRLKGVGRLDVLTSVNDRAIDYYNEQDLARLPADSLERRARLLHAMGEDDRGRGDIAAAAKKFEEARRTTATLLADKPDDPERIFANAQSEYWIGALAFDRDDWAAASGPFRAYKDHAERLIAIDPDNPVYRKELGYATGNLCALGVESLDDSPQSLAECEEGVRIEQENYRRNPDNINIGLSLSTRHAWLADAHVLRGDLEQAKRERAEQRRISEALLAENPENRMAQDSYARALLSAAELAVKAGDDDEARAFARGARTRLDALVAADPENDIWEVMRERLDRLQIP